MKQEELLPEAAIRRVPWTVDVDEIPMQFEYWPEPSDQLLTSIQEIGIVHQPLVTRVYPSNDGTPYFRVLDGKRRLRAAQQLGIKRVDVTILEFPESDRSSEISLGMHGSRSNNKVGEAIAIRSLVGQGKTLSEIAKLTGIFPSTIKSRMVLFNLTSHLWEALVDGRITVEIAIACAKLSPELQAQAYQILCTSLKLTHRDLKGLRSARRAASLDQLDLPGMVSQVLNQTQASAYLSDHDLQVILQLAEDVAEMAEADSPIYDNAMYLIPRVRHLLGQKTESNHVGI